jgi:sugar O-acyltransferase (sialic acid O-acetyltransferase NeuD family)
VKNKILGIIGSGDLGQQIANYAILDGHYTDIVFFDDFNNNTISRFPIIGNSKNIEGEFNNNSFDELIVGIGYKHMAIRQFLYEKFAEIIPFGKIIHSSCWVDSSVLIEDGTIIYPCCTIDANASIGKNTIVNLNCTISHDTSIGNHCFLSPRVALAGFVRIEDQCQIGINTTVIDNINIVSKTQIGGGTVVIDNINKSGLYVGNPFREVCKK